MVRALGIERRRVFIQQQQLGFQPRGHQQRQRLALAAGERTDGVVETAFQPHLERGDTFPQRFHQMRRQSPAEPTRMPTSARQRKIFSDRHRGRGAAERVLKHAADEPRTFVLRPFCDVVIGKPYGAFIDVERTRDGIQQRGFSRAVHAEHDDE